MSYVIISHDSHFCETIFGDKYFHPISTLMKLTINFHYG